MTRLHDLFHERYSDKEILILGFGREGQSTYRVLRESFPDKKLYVMDQKDVSEKVASDALLEYLPDYLKDVGKFNLVFKTPGIPIWEPALQAYLQQGGSVTSQLNEFLHVYCKQVIGVTGTKGKSTTSGIIAHCLETAGKSVRLLGNIGTPVFDGVEEIQESSHVVVEMSSYQLETVTVSPHIAVWLNLFQEHLNYHGTMEQYAQAKANIAKYQEAEDVIVYNKDQSEIVELLQFARSRKKDFSPKQSDTLLQKYHEVIQRLPKVVQENNVLPAVLVCQELGLSETEIIKGLQTFKTLPHRLEEVGTFNQVTFIDDTLATIPEATIQALQSLSKVDVLMLGGYDRGIDYEPVVDEIIAKNIPTVIFFPGTGEKMSELLKEKRSAQTQTQSFLIQSMEEAVKLAYEHAPQNGVVLLSPASPSFGQYRDYEDKSQQYIAWIKKLSSGLHP